MGGEGLKESGIVRWPGHVGPKHNNSRTGGRLYEVNE